jgi:hypothetical protein
VKEFPPLPPTVIHLEAQLPAGEHTVCQYVPEAAQKPYLPVESAWSGWVSGLPESEEFP